MGLPILLKVITQSHTCHANACRTGGCSRPYSRYCGFPERPCSTPATASSAGFAQHPQDLTHHRCRRRDERRGCGQHNQCGRQSSANLHRLDLQRAGTGPRSCDFDQKESLAQRKFAQSAIKIIAKACKHPEFEFDHEPEPEPVCESDLSANSRPQCPRIFERKSRLRSVLG